MLTVYVCGFGGVLAWMIVSYSSQSGIECKSRKRPTFQSEPGGTPGTTEGHESIVSMWHTYAVIHDLIPDIVFSGLGLATKTLASWRASRVQYGAYTVHEGTIQLVVGWSQVNPKPNTVLRLLKDTMTILSVFPSTLWTDGFSGERRHCGSDQRPQIEFRCLHAAINQQAKVQKTVWNLCQCGLGTWQHGFCQAFRQFSQRKVPIACTNYSSAVWRMEWLWIYS